MPPYTLLQIEFDVKSFDLFLQVMIIVELGVLTPS